MKRTTAGLVVLFSASLFALASCDRDGTRSRAPAAVAPAPSAPSSHAPPPPTAERPAPSHCATIDCFSGLIINVYPQPGWSAGKYRFVIRHDGKTTVCKGRIPRAPSEPSADIRCNGRTAVWDDGGFEIHGHPAVLDIDVVRDAVRLTHQHYDIEYKESSCGGPGCGSYRSAVVDLRLPASPD